MTTNQDEVHKCCDGECNHDDCCGKIPENCPLRNQDEVRETTLEILHKRDIRMKDYWKIVEEGFEGGYPSEWDAEIIAHFYSLLAKKREEAQRLPRLYIKRGKTDPRPDYESVPIDEVIKILS